MTRQEIIAFFARRLDALARHDTAALAADHAENGVVESPWAGTVSGRAAIEQAYRQVFAAFPDLAFQHEELLSRRNPSPTRIGGTEMQIAEDKIHSFSAVAV